MKIWKKKNKFVFKDVPEKNPLPLKCISEWLIFKVKEENKSEREREREIYCKICLNGVEIGRSENAPTTYLLI